MVSVDQGLWNHMWDRLTEIEDTTDLTIIEIQPEKVIYALGDRSYRPGWWSRPWKQDEDGRVWLWTVVTREDS